MQGNTLTGKMGDGTPYKLYFLPGGQATIQEGNGEPQSGTWDLDKSGDVCLKWPGAVAAEDGCLPRVERRGSQGDLVEQGRYAEGTALWRRRPARH